MKILISPAKKMRTDTDTLSPQALPAFLPETERLLSALRSLSRQELKQLWRCSDAITDLNVERLARMELGKGLTPALLSYQGIQYQYMAPGVFETGQFTYLQEHLRILSGFYGMLRPFDGVTPYRLEMQAKLQTDGAKDLYGYWGSEIADRRPTWCWTWPLRSTAGRCSPTCPPLWRCSPAPSASCVRTAGWWKRARCARWPGGRWSDGWQSVASAGARS